MHGTTSRSVTGTAETAADLLSPAAQFSRFRSRVQRNAPAEIRTSSRIKS